MTDEKKDPEKPEDFQNQLKDFLKDKLGGGQLFSFNLGGAQGQGQSAPPPPDPEKAREERLDRIRFDMKPTEVKAYLDRFVIGQDGAKKALSVAVCDHYNHVRSHLEEQAGEDYVKQNVILLGPTGVGKTYLVRTLANLVGVPFVKADITKFSETGYVGGDVDDLVRELLRMADGDAELAECGIIFLDEIDKIAGSGEKVGRDVSGRGVQTGLLKLLEETEVSSKSPFDMGAQMREMMQLSRGGPPSKGTINTGNILFVVSGAFTGLPDIIEKRLTAAQVGFGAAARDAEGDSGEENLLPQATTKDFIDYGFEPEFIGRLPIRVALSPLTEDDFYSILKHSEGSIVRQYRRSFAAFGIEAAFQDDGLRAVAEKALEEKTGARGLATVLESTLREFKFHLPGSPVKRLAVTRELVERPADVLERLEDEPDYGNRPFLEASIREYEEAFHQDHEIRIHFDDEAVEETIARSEAGGEKIAAYLDEALMDYVYGLRIIRDHTGKREFTLSGENIRDPRNVLDGWVKDALNSEKKA